MLVTLKKDHSVRDVLAKVIAVQKEGLVLRVQEGCQLGESDRSSRDDVASFAPLQSKVMCLGDGK